MKIEEARKKKEELEDDIKRQLNEFTAATGLVVTGIDLRMFYGFPFESSRVALISLEVPL